MWGYLHRPFACFANGTRSWAARISARLTACTDEEVEVVDQQHQQRQAEAAEEGLAEALETESDLADKLDRLGDVPDVIQSFNANFNLSLDKQFRSGISISAFYDLTGTGANYKGKKHDVDDGGMGVIDAYTSTLGFRVLIPLGRGRGVESTGARERAAQIDYEASEAALAHAVSFNAYTTLLAYWDVVAAQENLQVLETSLELNRKILETTRALIDADEIPRSELARTEARVAEVEAGVEAARRRLQTARIALATEKETGQMTIRIDGGASSPIVSLNPAALSGEQRPNGPDRKSIFIAVSAVKNAETAVMLAGLRFMNYLFPTIKFWI